MAKIAVAENLSQVKQELSDQGYQVVTMDEANEADCCVITGLDENMMGMAETMTKAPVINAQGLTANEIVNQVQQRIQLQ